jgi:hypothetical protein
VTPSPWVAREREIEGGSRRRRFLLRGGISKKQQKGINRVAEKGKGVKP